MSLDLSMERIDVSGESSPKHPRVLDDILAAVRAAIGEDEEYCSIRQRGRKTLEIDLLSGTGTVHPDHAVFSFDNYDQETDLKALFAIAKVGDMVIFTQDGEPILTDPRQSEGVPEGMPGFEDPPVAKNWKGLARLLRGASEPAVAYRKKVVGFYEAQKQTAGDFGPTGSGDETAVYVQPRDGEEAYRHLLRLFKCCDAFIAARGGRRIEGTIIGMSWAIRIPTGGGVRRMRRDRRPPRLDEVLQGAR